MPYKKHRIKKTYYSIGELATLLKVNTSKLRYWEFFYKIPVRRRKTKGSSKLERIYRRESAMVFVRINRLAKEEVNGKRLNTLMGIGRKLELI